MGLTSAKLLMAVEDCLAAWFSCKGGVTLGVAKTRSVVTILAGTTMAPPSALCAERPFKTICSPKAALLITSAAFSTS